MNLLPPPSPARASIRSSLALTLLKLLTLLVGAIIGTLIIREFTSIQRTSALNRHPDFSQFKAQYSRTYSSEEEHSFREYVYYSRLEKIAKHNAHPNASYRLGVNEFSDITELEFNQLFLAVNAIGRSKGYMRKAEAEDKEE